MKTKRSQILAILTIAILLCGNRLFAQSDTYEIYDPGDAKISLITCAPGSEIYELEGHSALRMQWEGNDYVVNWGLFDFDAPNFVYRFVKGETDYMVGIIDTDTFVSLYANEHRQVVEQVINLSPFKAIDVIERVQIELLPYNRTYRYNYVKNNCATRIIEIIEKSAAIKIQLGDNEILDADQATFRNAMRHYHRNYPWYQFGIDIALGSGLDQKIENRMMMFAPEALRRMAAKAQIAYLDGSQEPFISETIVLAPGNPEGIALPPTPWWLTPMAAMSLLLICAIAVSIRDFKRKKISRIFDTIFYSALAIAGLIVAFLIFISTHEASSPNYLFFWINPLCLLIPLALWIKRWRPAIMWIQGINLLGITAFAIIWLCGIQSGNLAFIPLMLADAVRAFTHIYIIRYADKNQ